jgi:RNA polymerase sigma factor (sigma-70 family)
MTERLTDEQRAIVDENLPMVLYIMRKYRAPIGMDAEDWLQECVIQMVRAVQFHDPAKGQLSTIFDRLVFIRRGNLNQYATRGNRGKVYLASSVEGEDSLGVLDVTATEHPWDQIDARELAKEAMQVCSRQEMTCFRLLAEGLNQKEIAREFGVSRQRITEVLTTAREKIAKAFPSLVVYSQVCAKCGGPAQRYSNGKNLYCTECSKMLRTGRKLRNEKQRKQRLKAAGA